MWGIIATWRMALEGVTESASALAAGKPVAPAVVDAVAAVEDFPFYKSVGYGGLPTENGEVELDAAYMDGDTLAFGAVGNLVDIANPVRGRLGDSPIIGSGFYCDSETGAATATGVGEDLMKGCTSYEIVRRMAQGMTPQQAADSVVFELEDKLMSRFGRAGDLSVVCMNSKGEFGAATNIKTFSFVVATARQPLTVFRTERLREKTHYHAVDEEWMQAYAARIRAPIEES